MRIPTKDFTDVTLVVSEDTYDHDDPDDPDDHDDPEEPDDPDDLDDHDVHDDPDDHDVLHLFPLNWFACRDTAFHSLQSS